jgi:hypothetical protein
VCFLFVAQIKHSQISKIIEKIRKEKKKVLERKRECQKIRGANKRII